MVQNFTNTWFVEPTECGQLSERDSHQAPEVHPPHALQSARKDRQPLVAGTFLTVAQSCPGPKAAPSVSLFLFSFRKHHLNVYHWPGISTDA